jgi:hypothetical protein
MTTDRPPHVEGTAAAQPPAALRTALVKAIGRRRRRMRFRLAIAGGACAALAAVLLGGGLLTQSPSKVLAINNDDGAWVKVRILDGQAGAEEMTRELQSAGIDAEVQLLPATPQLVGSWMGVREVHPAPPPPCNLPADAPPGLECVHAPYFGANDEFTRGDLLEIRRDAVYKLAGAQFLFYAGRAPGPGEQPLDRPPPESP